MSKLGEIRRVIKDFEGRRFTTTEVRKAINMYNKTNQRLADLEELGEIVRLGIIKTDGRGMREWQEVKINDALMSGAIKRSCSAKDIGEDSPWAKVYPEYFQLPNLQGTVRIFCELA